MKKQTNLSRRDRASTRGGAWLGGPSATLVLPAVSLYEWQVLCDHAAAAARQHGAVRLRVDGVDCVVRSEVLGAARPCGGCGRALTRVAFRLAWRDLCRDCVRLRLCDDGAESVSRRDAAAAP